MFRPSSLPMLAACPKWEGTGSENADTNAGSDRHAKLSDILMGRDTPDLEDEEQQAAVEWAAEYIKCLAPTTDHPLDCERHLALVDDQFVIITEGTPDAVCGPHLFDLKWRERNYDAQMAAYALMMIQGDGWDVVHVHVLFGERKRYHRFTLDLAAAKAMVDGILAKASAVDAQPTPCAYCDWCSRMFNCPAVLARVNAVIEHREDWELEQYHSSAIDDAAEMGRALRLARLLSSWCASVEYHAKQMATRQGTIPEGFRVQNRKGKQFIDDVPAAFGKASLPQDEFMKACGVNFTELAKTYAAFHGIKVAPSKRHLEKALGDLIQRAPGSISLVEAKGESQPAPEPDSETDPEPTTP